jgi:hypothetical protein
MKIQKKLFFILFIIKPFIAQASVKSARVAPAPHLTIPAAAVHSAPVSPQNAAGSIVDPSKTNAEEGNDARSKNRPQSPLTRSGFIKDFSQAKGQSRHDSKYKKELSANNKAEAENAAATSAHVVPDLSYKEFQEYINLPETKKKISSLIALSISHEKKVSKTIKNNVSFNATTGKASFLKVFENLAREHYKARVNAETVIVTHELIARKAEDIWDNREQYRSKCCFCC